MKKKLVFLLMALGMLSLCIAGMASADDCEHEFALRDCTHERQCSICRNWFSAKTEHNWESWSSNESGSSHKRGCTNYQCEAFDGGYHYGGTATCTEQAVCKGCGQSYGEFDPNGHKWGEWKSQGPYESHRHVRTCENNRQHAEEGNHTGGNPNCTEAAICITCGQNYLSASNHGDYPLEWQYTDNGEWHFQICTVCKFNIAQTYAPHAFDNDTDPICDTCGYTRNIEHTHSYGEWTSNNNGTHSRSCSANDDTQTNNCSGGIATCTGKAVCETCKTAYGNIDADNHNRAVIPAVAPTYTETGLTEGVKCDDCGEILVPQEVVPVLIHLPQTGDDSNVILWSALACISLLGMTMLAFKRKEA